MIIPSHIPGASHISQNSVIICNEWNQKPAPNLMRGLHYMNNQKLVWRFSPSKKIVLFLVTHKYLTCAGPIWIFNIQTQAVTVESTNPQSRYLFSASGLRNQSADHLCQEPPSIFVDMVDTEKVAQCIHIWLRTFCTHSQLSSLPKTTNSQHYSVVIHIAGVESHQP